MPRRPKDSIAETAAGLPDEGRLGDQFEAEDIGGAEADRQAEALRQRGWVGGRASAAEEAEAHPS